MEEEFKDFISFQDENSAESSNIEDVSNENLNVYGDLEKIDPDISEVLEENGMKLKVNRDGNIVKSIDIICSCGKKARLDIEYPEE